MGSNSPLNRMDLNLFVIFDAIYREQNLTRASESLFLSQPAVSHALARLRERFDDPLFERQGKRMQPTPLAHNIIREVRQGLGNLETALLKDTHFDPASSERHFNIVVPDMLEASFVHRLATHVLPEAPHIKLSSIRMVRSEIEQALQHGKADFAIDIRFPTSKDICREEVWAEEFVVVARRDHPALRQRKPRLTLERYLKAHHILVTNRYDGFGAEDYALSKLGKSRAVSMVCQHYYAANRVVRQSNLLLTLPRSYGQLLARNEDNVTVPLPFEMPPLSMHLYWLKKSLQDPALAWLKGHIEAQLANMRRAVTKSD